jgi:hypothetical protein
MSEGPKSSTNKWDKVTFQGPIPELTLLHVTMRTHEVSRLLLRPPMIIQLFLELILSNGFRGFQDPCAEVNAVNVTCYREITSDTPEV